MLCKICSLELTPDNTTAFDTHPGCMPVMRAQFYRELHRYRRAHPHIRQN